MLILVAAVGGRRLEPPCAVSPGQGCGRPAARLRAERPRGQRAGAGGRPGRQPARHHVGLRGGQHLRPRQRLRRTAQRRYRRPGEGRPAAGHDRGARARSSDRPGRGDAGAARVDAAATQGGPRAGARDLGSRQAGGREGLAAAAAGHHRRADAAAAGSHGQGGAQQRRRPGSAGQRPAPAEDLSERRGAVRRRHHPAQHRRRHPGAGRCDQRHLHVHHQQGQRDPHPGLRAAGRGVRPAARGRGRRARSRDARSQLSGHGDAHRRRAAARHAAPC